MISKMTLSNQSHFPRFFSTPESHLVYPQISLIPIKLNILFTPYHQITTYIVLLNHIYSNISDEYIIGYLSLLRFAEINVFLFISLFIYPIR